MKKQVSFPLQGDTTKEKNSKNRISFHHQSNNFHNFDANYNISNTKELLARQRSFVRPNSINYLGNDIDEGVELQRQRSFVIPGQYQVRPHSKKRGAVAFGHRGKPTMELYRPPTMRHSNENGYSDYGNEGSRPGLNIHAKEFVSIEYSKSSSNLAPHSNRHGNKLQHSKSGHNLRAAGMSLDVSGGNTSPPRVHFSDDKENEPDKNPGSGRSGFGNPIKRSKSLGSADFRNPYATERSPLADLGPFSQDVHNVISKALNDPNTLSARQLMDVVKHVCQRVVESSRYAEPTARLSIMIIEREEGETFLESLLNTCQEFFQEKDRLLRNSPPGPYPGYVASHPKWIAFMSFLNEMYTQLKRRHVQLMTQRMQNSDTPPGLLLLTLLAQCCHVCLREPAVNSLAQTECLFFVLTAVGKDIEVEIPHQMARVMTAARDAFLKSVHVAAVRKTLLQLIEMHASRWQLPASAVMYYYPGSAKL